MAFGVQRHLLGKNRSIVQRLQTRSFVNAPLRHADQAHHSYFRHDSPTVHFPERSAYARSISPHTQQGPSRFRELAEPQKWLIFFGGFFTFPIVCVAYYYGDWAIGPKLWTSEVKELEEQGLGEGSRGLLKSSENQFMETNNLFRILQRANAETKALHDLVLLWINPENGLHAARDTELLKSHPIKMSDGKQLDSSEAILIRILDRDSKTVVLLLGVDMSQHSSSESDPALAWCHDYNLRGWMDERAEQLKKRGDASEEGISLYCYTGTSSATSLPGKKGEMWQEARLFPEDLPDGFPLTSLESVKDEMAANAP